MGPSGTYAQDVRVLRILVASTLTIIFTAWSVHLFESQPSEVPAIQIPTCPTPPAPACIEHTLKVGFSGNLGNHWSVWVIWVFWALFALVWLAACALILWAPRRANDSDAVTPDEPTVDAPLPGPVRRKRPTCPEAAVRSSRTGTATGSIPVAGLET